MNRRSFFAALSGLLAAVPFIKARPKINDLPVNPFLTDDLRWWKKPLHFDVMASHPYYDRWLAAKGSRIYWSKKHDYYTFDAAIDGDWYEPNGQPVIGIQVGNNEAFVETADGTLWRLIGDPDDTDTLRNEQVGNG